MVATSDERSGGPLLLKEEGQADRIDLVVLDAGQRGGGGARQGGKATLSPPCGVQETILGDLNTILEHQNTIFCTPPERNRTPSLRDCCIKSSIIRVTGTQLHIAFAELWPQIPQEEAKGEVREARVRVTVTRRTA